MKAQDKLLSLTTHFENLRMHEDESLSDFYTNVCNIANKLFALAEKIPKTILASKIVRSLPDALIPKSLSLKKLRTMTL